MPNNCSIVEQRTLNLKRFIKDSLFHDDYIGFMNNLISSGYAEKVPTTDLKRSDGKVWYIPHHGGAWERLIHSIRKVLNSTLRTQSLDEEALFTVLCEVESILNSRPITKESTDPNDLEALTPNHLLLLKTKPCLPPGLFWKEDMYARRRWKQVQYMADLFWKRWTREYLPQLQERQKWMKIKRNFIPGDIVLIVDNSAPRNSWITGRITNVVPDSRGLVRRVWIKTHTSCICRPVSKICLLQESAEP